MIDSLINNFNDLNSKKYSENKKIITNDTINKIYHINIYQKIQIKYGRVNI